MKIIRLLLVLLVSLSLYTPVYGEEENYKVVDSISGLTENFAFYNEAYYFYMNNLDNYDNLLLYENDKVIFMEYGVVEFVGENNILDYYSSDRETTDYLCSTYGADGAYLNTSDDGQRVYFKVSGDTGYTNINNVILHPLEDLNFEPSFYIAHDDKLYHNILTQLEYKHYTYSLCLDNMPSFMNNDKRYYSYDGNYFYDDYTKMIDDYRNENYDQAINEEPYYNYYQYLPARSITNYTVAELEDYFYNSLGINGTLTHFVDLDGDGANDEINKSLLYGNIHEFFNAEAIYGSNALMMIASSIEESSYGKSLNAYMHNNLFANAAYETQNQAANERYDSLAESIYAHSKHYISNKYSNYLKSTYTGTYLGNKQGGINIEYSLDHYYGEKVASNYYKIDSALGSKDYNALTIGIINNLDALSIYKDDDMDRRLLQLNDIKKFAFVILDETDSTYKIQIDQSLNDEYIYDFDSSVGYIYAKEVDYVLNHDNMHDYELNASNYDFNGGSFNNSENLTIKSNKDLKIVPYKEGHEFTTYSLANINNVDTYVANYKRIDKIVVDYLLEKQKELLPYPNLDNAKITVRFSDGTRKKVKVTNEMISKYDPKNFDAQTVTVTYNGISESKDIQIDGAYYEVYEAINKAIESKDYGFVKDNMDTVSYPLKMSQIRQIDEGLKKEDDRNYVINDYTNKYNISVSGLDLSLDDRNNFSLIEDTYYVVVKDGNASKRELVQNVSKNYGFDLESGINISFRFNYQKLALRGSLIVQMDLDDKQIDKIYSVYHVDSNGNIIKCRTTQTKDFIQFMLDEAGDYYLLSMPSFNTYNFDNDVENLNYSNMGFDNNRTNIEFLLGLFTIILALVGILVYYRILGLKEKQWKDYKKSLLRVDTVQEEKLKN